MDLQDDANMPICNLAKSMHHAWSMQSNKKIVDLYEQQLMTSFEHLSNQGIRIISWEEI